MKQVTFITGNQGKWQIAKDIFGQYDLDLKQEKIDTPEIQSMDVTDIALQSVFYAAEKFQKPVIKSDVGYYIQSLNGFPGPFIKFINQTLQPAVLLALMIGKTDRTVILRECLAYAAPNREPKTFIHEQKAILANQADGTGSSIDQILILDGFDKPKGCYSSEIIFDHWTKTLNVYHDMAHYLQDNL